ncbi:MAG: nitroreductase family protein, partial [Oscillospiraceae bacterium]
GDLDIKLVYDDDSLFTRRGADPNWIKNARNAVVISGKKDPMLGEECGYWGEKLVIYAQTLGLNTCWITGTYNKKAAKAMIPDKHKFCAVIAIGYGTDAGTPHKGKTREDVMKVEGEAPEWFLKGIDYALLAPTAANAQNFMFTLEGTRVGLESTKGPEPEIDLGIVKYHFEIGAERRNFTWK